MINKIESFLDIKIIDSKSLGGGCIADSRVIEDNTGKKYFLKHYVTNSSIHRAEADGLTEILKSGAIRVPKVIYADDSFLLLEFINSKPKTKNFFSDFGKKFADLHKVTCENFGFFENNFIGSNPQKNLPRYRNWIDFYVENRLLFQFQLAEKNGYVSDEMKKYFDKFIQTLPSLLPGSEENPSLLHGDLWGGNYITDENGEVCLIDPAVYYGDREADLAMTKLFGGFNHDFYEAYNEEYPLRPGHSEREDIYKLYHVMNHLNLFGGSYYHQTISILKRYI